MIMIALTSVISVIIVYVSHSYSNQPVPQWARKVSRRQTGIGSLWYADFRHDCSPYYASK